MAEKVFDPLQYASPKAQKRYAQLARDARTRYRAAVKLFCVLCVGESHEEAKRCTANECPLWSLNRRIFK